MAWLRLDPGFSRHVKRLRSSPAASWLWICSMDYCATYLTDGFVPDAAVPTLAAIPLRRLQACVDQLLSVSSWELVEGGYFVHDYLEYNPSSMQVKSERESARVRSRKARGLPPDAPNVRRISAEGARASASDPEAGLAMLAKAMGLSLEDARARQEQARARANTPPPPAPAPGAS